MQREASSVSGKNRIVDRIDGRGVCSFCLYDSYLETIGVLSDSEKQSRYEQTGPALDELIGVVCQHDGSGSGINCDGRGCLQGL